MGRGGPKSGGTVPLFGVPILRRLEISLGSTRKAPDFSETAIWFKRPL